MNPPAPQPAIPPPPDAPLQRYARGTLLCCVLAIPFLIAAAILLRKYGLWYLANWTAQSVLLFAGVGLVAALIRLAHALWGSTQYVLGELLVTFLAASIASLGFIELVKFSMREESRDMNIQRSIIIVVIVTFVLFLAGSAWGWSIFRRAPALTLNRIAVLACGWSSSIGLVCFTTLVLFMLIFFLVGDFPRHLRVFLWVCFGGSFLTIPGFWVERAAKRSMPAITSASERTPAP